MWACSVCTLENPALSISCAVCHTLKKEFNLDLLHGSTPGAAASPATAAAVVATPVPDIIFVDDNHGQRQQQQPVWNPLQYDPDAGAADVDDVWADGVHQMLPRLIRATKARLLTTLSSCLICDKDLGL